MLTIFIISHVRSRTQGDRSTTSKDALVAPLDVRVVYPCPIRGMVLELDFGMSPQLAIPYQFAMIIAWSQQYVRAYHGKFAKCLLRRNPWSWRSFV